MELAEIPNEQISNAEIRDRDVSSSKCAYTHHFVATEAGAEIGLLSVDLIPEEEHFVIYEIFVPLSLRRRGIGNKLLDAAEQMARGLGYKSALLIPKTLNEAFAQEDLEKWYSSRGYLPNEDYDNGAFIKQLTRPEAMQQSIVYED